MLAAAARRQRGFRIGIIDIFPAAHDAFLAEILHPRIAGIVGFVARETISYVVEIHL
jgi:hypothetical protein